MRVNVLLRPDDDCPTCIHVEVCGFKKEAREEMNKISEVIRNADLDHKLVWVVPLKCDKHVKAGR